MTEDCVPTQTKVAWSRIAVVGLLATAVLAFALWIIYSSLMKIRTSFELRVPVHFINIHGKCRPFVMVKINEEIGWMQLDTGASCSILHNSNVKNLTRPTGKYQTLRFLWHVLTMKSERRKVDILSIGERQFRDRSLPSVDLSKTGLPSHLEGLPVWGILGEDFLSEWNYVRISYDQIVLSQKRPKLEKGTLKFPLMILDNLPYLYATNSEGQMQFWLLDTGFTFNSVRTTDVLVDSSSSSHKALLESIELKSSTEDVLWLPAQGMAETQNGLFRALSFISGIIGSGIIERFEVILDYRNGWAYFVPYSKNNRRGTLGTVLYTANNKLFAIFSFAPEEDRFVPVEILSVDGSSVEADPERAERKLRTLIAGQLVKLRVRSQTGIVKEWQLTAYAKSEVPDIRFKLVIDPSAEDITRALKLSLEPYNHLSSSSDQQTATTPSFPPSTHYQVQGNKDGLIEILTALGYGVTVKEIPLQSGGKRYDIQAE